MAWVPQVERDTALLMLREMGWRLVTEEDQDAITQRDIPDEPTGEPPSPTPNGDSSS